MSARMPRRGLMLAAPASGSGKTVITLAILRALRRRGLDVAPAKAGPDYIDPVFHEISSGTGSVNLDAWAMSTARLQALAGDGKAPLLVVEAMMGLFDGAADGSGSAADLAALLGLPVILVVDAAKQSHSVAALVKGFREFRTDITVSGVILNRVGSDRHEAMLRAAIEQSGVEVIGVVPRDQRLSLPERHLGLVQAQEMTNIEAFVDTAADIIAGNCDLDRLVAVAAGAEILSSADQKLPMPLPLGQRIAVAKDAAFSFIYPHILSAWRANGAELSFFSPLGDEAPAQDSDAVYLPGGYPELHCGALAAAQNFHQGMIAAKDRGAAIYGECGGYMVLGKGITDTDGKHHGMLGFLDLETSFAARRLHLGYRRITGLGGAFRHMALTAHEFHYTTALKETGEPLFAAVDALGNDLGNAGLRDNNVFGSYLHVIDRMPI